MINHRCQGYGSWVVGTVVSLCAIAGAEKKHRTRVGRHVVTSCGSHQSLCNEDHPANDVGLVGIKNRPYSGKCRT